MQGGQVWPKGISSDPNDPGAPPPRSEGAPAEQQASPDDPFAAVPEQQESDDITAPDQPAAVGPGEEAPANVFLCPVAVDGCFEAARHECRPAMAWVALGLLLPLAPYRIESRRGKGPRLPRSRRVQGLTGSDASLLR